MPKSLRPGGAGLTLTAGIFGAAVAFYDYVTPATGIDHTGGIILVLASCLLMALAAFGVLAVRSSPLTSILIFLIVLDILGTGTAAWFLESELVIAAMVVAAVGVCAGLTSRRVLP